MYGQEISMKFLRYLIIAVCLSQVTCFANLNDIYIANIQYDWINKDIVERQDMIDEVKDILFNGDNLIVPANVELYFSPRSTICMSLCLFKKSII